MKYQDLMEYALLIVLAAFVAAKVYGPMGKQLNAALYGVAAKLEATTNGR